jgi:hypothetical protein
VLPPPQVQALDQAFKRFVNTNIGGSNMSELLAYYCDHLMRSTSRTSETELEREFDQIVRLFCYQDDKDLFHESYRRALSKRLLVRPCGIASLCPSVSPSPSIRCCVVRPA